MLKYSLFAIRSVYEQSVEFLFIFCGKRKWTEKTRINQNGQKRGLITLSYATISTIFINTYLRTATFLVYITNHY